MWATRFLALLRHGNTMVGITKCGPLSGQPEAVSAPSIPRRGTSALQSKAETRGGKVDICGRKVKIVIGAKIQTVNICTSANILAVA